MKRVLICFVILFSAKVSLDVEARGRKAKSQGPMVVELTLRPMKAAEPNDKYRLLPRPEQLSDSDAVPLYLKAIQSLPKDLRTNKIDRWRDTPLEELPISEVQSALTELEPVLQPLGQAAGCKECKWPKLERAQVSRELMKDLSQYRQAALILALKLRLQIAQGQYEEAIGTMRTGIAMARHLAKGPAMVQGMTGIAVAVLMLKQSEQLLQVSDGPNLYFALRNLPRPLIDRTGQMKQQTANLKSSPQYKDNPLARRMLEKHLQGSFDQVRVMMKKLDRHVAALQCVEGLRLYAAAHDGKFPGALLEIGEVKVPDDPVTEKPFVYKRTGSKAVLEAPAPKGRPAKDAMRYELTLEELE